MIIFRQRGCDWHLFRYFAHVTFTLGLGSIVLNDHHPALGFITSRGYPKTWSTSAWRSCPTTLRVSTHRGSFPFRIRRGDCFHRGSWSPTKRRTSMGVQHLEEPTERTQELEVNDSHIQELQDQEQANRQAKDRPQKSLLGKAGDVARNTFNALMGAATLASIVLAAQTLWELHGTPLTLTNAVPTLSKLLPLTGIGVFGAAQLVGLIARVIRVIFTLPIMISGTWVILQNAPQVPFTNQKAPAAGKQYPKWTLLVEKLLPKGSDLSGAGSVLAVLATPEVLEAAAVLAFLGGMVLWALNMSRMIFGAFLSKTARDDEG